jgi:ABC-type transport system involved in multi-copper enzyme maturation permease subunit
MIAAIRAEFARLFRRRVLIATLLTSLVVGIGGAMIVLAAAEPAREVSPSSAAPTLEALSTSGGGTQVFRYVVSFAGTLVFVVFIGLFALEFSRGTYRTMLLRQPRRIQLLTGRYLALAGFTAMALAGTELVTWVTSRIAGPAFDISTGSWTSAAALGSALQDFGTVLVWLVGYSVLGMTVAVLLRSVPIALAVGIAWAGPAEHLIGDAWSAAEKFFPGLLLEIVGRGGTATVSTTRAITTAAAYVAVAAAVSCLVFARRDATA